MTRGPASQRTDGGSRAAWGERPAQGLGDYLSALVLDDAAAGVRAVDLGAPPPAPAAAGDLHLLALEIQRLAARVEAAQTRSSRALAAVDRAVLGALTRVERQEQAAHETLARADEAATAIAAAQAALRRRVEALEQDAAGAHALVGVQALDSALAALRAAVHAKIGGLADRIGALDAGVDRRLSTLAAESQQAEQRSGELERSLDAALRRMDAVVAQAGRSSRKSSEAESRADKALAATAALGKALESSVVRSRALSQDVLDRVESIEGQTREAVASLKQAVTRISDRLERIDAPSAAAHNAVVSRVDALDERLGALAAASAREGSDLRATLQRGLDTLADDLSRPIHELRSDVERGVEQALRSNQPEKIERLERTVSQLQVQLADADARRREAVAAMEAQVERLTRAADARLDALAGAGGPVDEVRRELMALAAGLGGRVDALEGAAASTADALAGLKGEVGDTLQWFERQAAGAIDAVAERVVQMGDRLQERADASFRELSERLDALPAQASAAAADEFSLFADRIDERVRESERRSAEAIAQIGEQVARVADRLSGHQQEALRSFEARLQDSGRDHETRLADALAEMSRRLDEIGDQSVRALAPMQNTVASLAQRLSDVEDQRAVPAPAALAAAAAPAVPDEPLPIPPRSAARLSREELDVLLIDDPEAAPALADEFDGLAGVDPPPFDIFADPPLPASREADERVGAADLAAEDADFLEAELPSFVDGPAFADLLADVEPDASPDRHAQGEASRSAPDYLAEARRAALRQRPESDAGRRHPGRAPIVASAALALAVAGGGAWTYMRGKQEASGDAFARLDPQAPFAGPTEADAAAAADALFGGPAAPAADEEDATDPADGGLRQEGVEDALFDDGEAGEALLDQPVSIEAAAAAGDPVARYDLALALMQQGERPRAVTLLREAAADGLVMAQYRLAKVYERGEGVPRDVAAARNWTEQAAIGGNVKAMHDLAIFYAEGDAGPQSYSAAVEWLRQAAELGLVDSQYNLAVLYERGLGVSRDMVEAAFWFEVAARSGDADAGRRAQSALGRLPSSEALAVKSRAAAFRARTPDPRANGEFGPRSWEVAPREQIAEIQRLLARLGYQPGEAQGEMGARTADAIRQFEQAHGFAVTGEPSAGLLRQLNAATRDSGR